MYNNKKERGAVSVFLALILVPCIVFASLFVDLGRVHLSQSLAKSSSELALNTLLTSYDGDLREWYGMIASCQDIESFYEESAKFFLRTISSQNLAEDEVFLLSDVYSQITGDQKIFDLLQVECQTPTAEIVKEVKDANLSNPTLIKDQIVEFMKYRAPIEITAGVISKFVDENGKSTGEIEQLEEADKNEELVEAKQDFYETEGKLLKSAYKSYLAILDYNDAAREVGLLKEGGMQAFADRVNSFKTVYEEIHKIAVKNLYNTDDVAAYTHVQQALGSAGGFPHSNVRTEYYYEDVPAQRVEYYTFVGEDGVERTGQRFVDYTETVQRSYKVYTITSGDFDKMLNDLSEKIAAFKTSISDFEGAGATLLAAMPGEGADASYHLQWWIQMDKALHKNGTNYTNKIKTAARNMMNSYSKLKGATADYSSREPDEYVIEGGKKHAASLLSEVVSLQSKYLGGTLSSGAGNYYTIISTMNNINTSYKSLTDYTYHTVTVNGETKTIEQWFDEISSFRDNLKKVMKALDKAINGQWIAPHVPSLASIEDLVEDYEEYLGKWKAEAGKNETVMQQEDNAAFAGGGDDPELAADLAVAQEITKERITELKTRLNNIYNQLVAIQNALDHMKYGGKKLTDIGNYNEFEGKLNNKVKKNEIPYKNGELDTYCQTTFGQLFEGEDVVLPNAANDDYQPNLEVKKPALYAYYQEKFGQVSTVEKEKFDNTEKEEDQAKKDADEQEKKAKEGQYRGGGEAITNAFSSSSAKYSALSSFVTSVVGLVQNIISGNLDAIRDDIYVTTYITEMFSFATQDREIIYNSLDKSKRTSMKLDSMPEMEKTQAMKDLLSSEKYTDYYNKSLTNKVFSKANNKAYLAEVEYILYGKSDNAANIKEAYGDIFGIRFVLNSVSAFHHHWNNGTIRLIANALSAAFSYVVPASVIKAVLLVLLATMETCMDNSRLGCGMPVELYKGKNDWWLLPKDGSSNYAAFFSKLVEGLTGNCERTNEDKGLFYSDYLTLFVYTGLAGGGNVATNMYLRIAEVIQSNIGKLTGNTGYSLAKSRMYFKLEAKLRVKPLMVAMPMFDEYENGFRERTDWCTYTIKTVRGYS